MVRAAPVQAESVRVALAAPVQAVRARAAAALPAVVALQSLPLMAQLAQSMQGPCRAHGASIRSLIVELRANA